MEQIQPGFAAEKRADNDNRKPSTSVPAARVARQQPKQESLGERWSKVQPTKMTAFWLCLAAILLTMLVGFNWGGWVTGGTAQKLAAVTARDAVVQRLAPICVAQFNLDAGKAQKLTELQALTSYRGGEYVKTQGWATLPGEAKPDSQVANACAKQLMLLNP